MNLLILGGLFVVALLAIGGAVWLSRGEKQETRTVQATSAATGATGAQTASAATATSVPVATPLPAEQSETVPVMGAAVARKEDQMASAPTLVADEDKTGHPFSMLNGQFYELASELRALHRESQDIERRLGILSDLVSRVEREYGEIGVEAE